MKKKKKQAIILINQNLRDNMKISIVIPIYQVEAYLEECLQSVKLQSYSNLDVILVDDGSKDNSCDIYNKYLEDERFFLIKKLNGGLSSARNIGLEFMEGTYLREFINKYFEGSFTNNLQSLEDLESSINFTNDFYHTLETSEFLDKRYKRPSCNLKNMLEDKINITTDYGEYFYKPCVDKKEAFKIFKDMLLKGILVLHARNYISFLNENILNFIRQPFKDSYIHFLDSDDYFKKDCIKECVRALNEYKDLDLVVHDYEHVYDGIDYVWSNKDPNHIKKDVLYERYGLIDNMRGLSYEEVKQRKMIYMNTFIISFAWKGLIRTNILNKIDRFLHKLEFEDVYFGHSVFSVANKACYIRDYLMFYRIRPNSISAHENNYKHLNLDVALNPYLERFKDHFANNYALKRFYLSYSYYKSLEATLDMKHLFRQIDIDSILSQYIADALHILVDAKRANAKSLKNKKHLVAIKALDDTLCFLKSKKYKDITFAYRMNYAKFKQNLPIRHPNLLNFLIFSKNKIRKLFKLLRLEFMLKLVNKI